MNAIADAIADTVKRLGAPARDVNAHIDLAERLQDVGDLRTARTVLLKVLNLDFSDIRVLRALAKLELAAQDWIMAETYARAALVVNQRDKPLRFDLAAALLGQGRREEADKAIRVVVKRSPFQAIRTVWTFLRT